jgi:hypothetical protein
VRLVAAHHDACDGDTRVSLPRAVPALAVRRVVCDRCSIAFAPAGVAELSLSGLQGLALPSFSMPSFSLPELRRPSLPAFEWRWVSLAVAAVAVIAILSVVQSGDESPAPSAPAAVGADGATAPTAAKRAGGGAKVAPTDAQLISESTFQLALPPGWERTAPSGGATFAAVAPDGDADVMLWIERDPELDFATFERRSLTQLESIAGSSGVVRRNPGPTPETTTSVIAPTDAPDGAPNYEVLLSGGPGNQWYYLATTSQPGATAEATTGVELVQGSFLPQGRGQ